MSQKNNRILEYIGFVIVMIAIVIDAITFKISHPLEVNWKILVGPAIHTICITIGAIILLLYFQLKLLTILFFCFTPLWFVWFNVIYALLRGMNEYTTDLPWWGTTWFEFGVGACFLACAFASIFRKNIKS